MHSDYKRIEESFHLYLWEHYFNLMHHVNFMH